MDEATGPVSYPLPDPISYAVDKCLKYATAFDSPALAATDFIDLLKRGGTLSEGDIAEVSRRVIDELGKRAHRTRFPEW
jgi:hypothetical protein